MSMPVRPSGPQARPGTAGAQLRRRKAGRGGQWFKGLKRHVVDHLVNAMKKDNEEIPGAAPAKPATAHAGRKDGKKAGAQAPKAAKRETGGAVPGAKGAEPAAQGPDMASLLKEIEGAMFSVRFYPVAVNEQAKNDALGKLERIYSEGSETVRQMLIYMIHEYLATSTDLKIMHTLEYFKMKTPAADSSQQRMNVYRAIFNYNTSMEGLLEFIRLLGRLKGGDDAVKLLTYHYSRLCTYENEASHVLRAGILQSLGKAESRYALLALMDYAEYTDNERSFSRIVSALTEWEGKLGLLKMPEPEMQEIHKKLRKIISSDFGGSHYG
jgi:hypothetical protein